MDQLEVLPPTPDLTVFGPDSIEPIPCISASYQIAQKLHACTEVKPGEDNERLTDLIDLQLLDELVDDRHSVRTACEEVFGLRAKHPWPPAIVVYASWTEAYAASAIANRFSVTDVAGAAANVTALIARTRVA